MVLRAYRELIHFDRLLSRGDFAALYREVRDCPFGRRAPSGNFVEEVCSAMDVASIWYWKQVFCLQRSAAATCMLKRRGVAARMIIGAQQMPFKAHAWVEVDGVVVNDKPYMREMYVILDQC
jgi:hypothetical protein